MLTDEPKPMLERLIRERDALYARVKVLEDALRPFADCIDENGWLTVRRVTHGEARAARKALEHRNAD